MKLRTKTRRRLFLMTVVVLTTVALAGTGAGVRLAYLRKAALRGREDGLVAIKQGDYPRALKSLGTYLGRNPSDADILVLYAKARQNVEETNNSQVGQAIALYQRVLELRPEWIDAERPLLDLYAQVGFNSEAIALADKIISQQKPVEIQSESAHALLVKTTALLRMQRLDEAQRSVQELCKLDPADLDSRILEIGILLRRQTADKVRGYVNKLAGDHPNEPRFELLKSIAASLAGDEKAAADLVRPLTKNPPLDETYTRYLVRQLDHTQLFDESFAVIERAAKNGKSDEMSRLLVRRLFETNQYQRLVEQTSNVDATATTADPELLAMRVKGLNKLHREPEANQLIEAMLKRGQKEGRFSRWASALQAGNAVANPDPVNRAAVLRDALAANPGNPILESDLADAYMEAGLPDKAMAAWRDVIRLAPEWALPLLRVSQSFLTSGRGAEALDFANQAMLRSPNDRDVQIAAVFAAAATLPPESKTQTDQILQRIAEIRSRFTDTGDLVPLEVNILSQQKTHDAALQALQSALATTPPLAENVYLALAQVSRVNKLGLEQQCFDQCKKAHGDTASLAFSRALWLKDQHQDAEAMSTIQDGLAANPKDVAWRTAWAKYLDIVNDKRAKAEWVMLGDENPKAVKVQWDAVSAQAVQNDHDFVGRTIDRLVTLLGDDSLALHMLRARWYLTGDAKDTNEKDATQAAILLGEVSRSAPDMLAPRLLLAKCYIRLGNINGAIDQMAIASDSRPDIPGLAIEVARMTYLHGDYSRSRQYIERATHSKQTTAEIVRKAAGLLAMQGDYVAATDLLENLAKNQKDLPPDVMIAALYRQLNQLDKAAEVCKRLLGKPDATGISFCADFYASQKKFDQAAAALALLDKLELPPGRKSSILANYQARYGKPEDALALFQLTTKEAPQEPMVWQQLIGFYFAVGKVDDAIHSASEAAQKVPKPEGFDFIQKNATLIQQSTKVVGAQPLLMTLGYSLETDKPVMDAISAMVAADRDNRPKMETAAALRSLADKNPRIMALQTATLEFYLDSGQVEEAVKLATQTAQSFPSAAEPLRVQTSALGSISRWDEALSSAKEWRRRDSLNAIEADTAIAEADLQLNDISSAHQQIEPYLDQAQRDPEKFAGVLMLRARELLMTHQPDEAEKFLQPFLKDSFRVRRAWMVLAEQSVDDSNRAAAWLDTLSPLATTDPREIIMLADAWRFLAERWQRPEYRQKAAALIQPMLVSNDCPRNALFMWGTICEQNSDWENAVKAYRRILAGNPNDALACNNLASVLVKSGGDLNEANQLVEKAISIEPRRTEYLDTRAMVKSAQKDFPTAISSLRDAQRIEPRRMEWRVNLLALLADSGQTNAALAEIKKIDSDVPTFTKPPPEVLAKYQQIRTKLR